MILGWPSILVPVCVRLVDLKSKWNLTFSIFLWDLVPSFFSGSPVDIIKILFVVWQFRIFSQILPPNIKMTLPIFFLELVKNTGLRLVDLLGARLGEWRVCVMPSTQVDMCLFSFLYHFLTLLKLRGIYPVSHEVQLVIRTFNLCCLLRRPNRDFRQVISHLFPFIWCNVVDSFVFSHRLVICPVRIRIH